MISYGAILASFDPKAGITRVALASFGLSFLAFWNFLHFWHFGILRLKSKHHLRSEVPWFWHLCSCMMPTFGSHDAKMQKMSKMPKCQKKMPKPENE